MHSFSLLFFTLLLLPFSQLKAFDLNRHLTELEENGVTLIPNLFTPEEIVEIANHYESIKAKVQHVLDLSPGHERIFQTDAVTTHSRYWKVDEDFILQAGKGRFD